MKKTLKNIVISIAIIYLILSIVYTIFNSGITQENIEISMHQKETFFNEQKISINQLNQSYGYGMLHVAGYHVWFFILSGILGTLIGSLLSLKENSKAKYILFFILCDAIYTFIWVLIESMLFKVYGAMTQMYLVSYIEAVKRYFLSYIFVYALLVTATIVVNKYKVKVLNESLKMQKTQNKKLSKFQITQKQKKNLMKATVVLTILVVIIVGCIITKKSLVLIHYAEKVNEIENCDNFIRVSTDFKEENGTITPYRTTTLYHNGTKNVIKEEGQEDRYEDSQQNTVFFVNRKTKTASKFNNQYSFSTMEHVNNAFFSSTAVRIWGNILLSFEVSIKTQEVDGIECYVLIRDEMVEVFINKETYEPIQEIWLSAAENDDSKYIKKYTYYYGAVTPEEVELPDLSEYTIIER